MSAFTFLLLAAGLIVVGVVVVVVRNHEPKREHDAITDFQKEMRALSPEARRATDVRLRPREGDTGD